MAYKAIQIKDESGQNVYPVPTYPIGTIIFMANDIHPGTRFGGSWEQLDSGIFFIGASTDFVLGSTGGSNTVTLTTSTIPSHTHITYGLGTSSSPQRTVRTSGKTTTSASTVGTTYVGGGQAHDNLPPYIDIKAYKRVQ